MEDSYLIGAFGSIRLSCRILYPKRRIITKKIIMKKFHLKEFQKLYRETIYKNHNKTRGGPSIPSTAYSPIEWKKTYAKALKKYGQIKGPLNFGIPLQNSESLTRERQ